MSGPELATCLNILGWSQRQLAGRLGVSEQVVRKRIANPHKDAVWPEVAAWIKRRVAALQADPLPRGWAA